MRVYVVPIVSVGKKNRYTLEEVQERKIGADWVQA